MIAYHTPDSRHLPLLKPAMTHTRLLVAGSIFAFMSSLIVGMGLAANRPANGSAGFAVADRPMELPPPVCTAGSHTTMTPACDSVHAARLTNLTDQTVVFKVTNTSGSDESYDLSCTYTAPISSCSASSFVDVPASSTRNTTVVFSTGADTGMATLSLQATSIITSDVANWRVKVPVRFDTLKISADFTNNDNQNAALCANSCFAVTQAASTVPYFSLGSARSVSLAYNGDRVALRPFVYADVMPPTGANAPTQYTMRVKVDGAFRKFANGDDSLRFSVPTGTVRLGGQIDSVTDKATGVYPLEIHIKGKYSNHEENKTIVSKLIVVNERTSPIARGWAVAGLQRVYLQADSSLLVTDGTGSAIYFQRSGGTYVTPRGDYSTWSVNWTGVDTMFTRIFPDSTKIRFNNLGRMRSVTDRFGNQTTFEHDGSARLLKVYDPFRLSGGGPGKAYIRLHYKSSGYGLDSIIGPGATGTETGGSVSRVTVGSDSLLTAFIDPDGDSTSFGYISKRMTSVRDRRGSTSTYHLNALSWKVDSVSLPQVPIDAGNGSTTNHTIVLKYRAWQHAGVPTTSTYSTLATPISSDSMTGRLIDGGGDTTTFNPDRWGQPLRSKNALAQVTTIYRTQTARPEPDSIKSHTGSVQRFAYTGAFLTAYTTATGTVTNYRYGSYGQLDSTYGSSQPTTRYFRDNTKGGRVDSVRATASATKKTRYYYNATYQDRPDSTKDPEGHRTTFRYDAAFGNLDSTLAPGGGYTKLIFDRFGQDSVVRSTSRVARGMAYDALGRIRKRWLGTDTTNAVTYTYDQLFRTRVKDRKGQVYKFEFNALGWLTKEYDSFDTTKSIQYRYNKDGFSTSRTTRRGHRIDQTFDQLHRIVSKRDTASLLDSLGYSTDGRKVASWNSISRDSVFLAQSGWTDSVVTRIASKRFRVKYRPDALLRLDTMDVANDAGITFAHRRYVYSSTNGMLDRVKIGSDSVVFSYNADFLRTNTNYVPEHTNPVAYTSQHRYFTDTLKNALAQQVFWRGVGYDTLGRVNQYLSDDATNTPHRRFAYDSLGQLSQDEKFTPSFPCPTDTIYGHKCTGSAVSTVNFKYDAAGNDTTAAFGATFSTSGNRMLTRGSVTYSYDADGHRTVVKKSSTDSTIYYWSPDGVLEKVVSAATTLEYSYNAAGDLVRRKKNGSVDRILLWANGHLLAELNGTATNRIAEYVYYPGMDAPLAVVSGATSIVGTRYFQQDALGNVTAVLGDLPKSGATAYQKLSYDVWGKVEQTTGGLFASDTNRLRWKGLIWEGDSTQLYYMRARWYDPTQRRFISEDPIGLAGGINMYVFGGNEPLNSSDPSGLVGDRGRGNCEDGVCFERIRPQTNGEGGVDDPFGFIEQDYANYIAGELRVLGEKIKKALEELKNDPVVGEDVRKLIAGIEKAGGLWVVMDPALLQYGRTFGVYVGRGSTQSIESLESQLIGLKLDITRLPRGAEGIALVPTRGTGGNATAPQLLHELIHMHGAAVNQRSPSDWEKPFSLEVRYRISHGYPISPGLGSGRRPTR